MAPVSTDAPSRTHMFPASPWFSLEDQTMNTKTPIVLSLLTAIVLSGCTGGGEIYRQAGSSTVLPIAQAWAEEFEAKQSGVSFVVSGGGTGSGFQQFCKGEIQIADASRPIKDSEKTECAKNGIDPFELEIAIDGLAVVVSKQNTFVHELTVEELNRIWTANTSKQANKWSDLRPQWPDQRIELYGPGTDSGTFDYFVEVIIHPFDGKSAKTRSDYTPSEDDHILVQGVRSNAYALAYFGLAYVRDNQATIRALAIDKGEGGGPVEPSASNVESGKYQPLARPIFMYTNGKPTAVLLDYFKFGLGAEGQALVADVGYIPLPAAKRQHMLDLLA
jgi:phosphate transport system substrate-binding protein